MDFLPYFSKNLTNPAFKFCAFGRKTLFTGNFWENFRNFSKENCKKCIILAYFSKNLTNNAFNFCPFRWKAQLIGKFEKDFENFQKTFLRKLQKTLC